MRVYDIEDAERFVAATVRKKLIKLRNKDERDEMNAEGMVILFDLARRYDPSKERPNTKPGHVCKTVRCCKPSFAGYASRLLPPKLLDAWHAHHPEHLLRTQPDGSRKYVYLVEACSLHDTGVATGSDARGHWTTRAQATHGMDDGEDEGRNTVDRPGTRHVGMFMPVPEIKTNEPPR